MTESAVAEREAAQDWIRTQYDVSRETLERLDAYVALLKRWTKSVNLISRNSVPHIWSRHILDSAQLVAHAPTDPSPWLDLGSGGGLPALVCAILSGQMARDPQMTLVESDQRKSAFLRQAAAELDLKVAVLAKRIEDISPIPSSIVTARALAPLAELLRLASPHAMPETTLIFPKGETFRAEIESAKAQWRFTHSTHPSITNTSAGIVVVRGVERV
ncbi:MAG: 16S rRNA (guanine(527)-N(7))-methyltransferase RsmG [Pseudomonadota bacterium]